VFRPGLDHWAKIILVKMLAYVEESVLCVGAFVQEKKYALHHPKTNLAMAKKAFTLGACQNLS
jgi:hypothetical protein